MTEKEKTLLAGCICGDKASWDAFIIQYSSLVYHTIRKTFATYHAESTSDLVDDLFQEFFLAVVREDFKKLRQFRGDKGCSLPSWLRLVAARLTIDELRKRVLPATEAAFDLVQAEDASPAPDLTEEQLISLQRELASIHQGEKDIAAK